MHKHTITAEEARQLFSYNPDTGDLTWRVSRGARARAGNAVGWKNGEGYLRTSVNRKRYLTHRLAWLIHYGSWPRDFIDHINGDRSDNRLVNLREASRAENGRNRGANRNNTSGYKGVSWHKANRRWVAQVYSEAGNRHLGCFNTPEEAHAAYCAAAVELYGEFANFG